MCLSLKLTDLLLGLRSGRSQRGTAFTHQCTRELFVTKAATVGFLVRT